MPMLHFIDHFDLHYLVHFVPNINKHSDIIEYSYNGSLATRNLLVVNRWTNGSPTITKFCWNCIDGTEKHSMASKLF